MSLEDDMSASSDPGGGHGRAGDFCGSGSGVEGPAHGGHDLLSAGSPDAVVQDLSGDQDGAGGSCGRGSGNTGPDGGAVTVGDDRREGGDVMLPAHRGSVASGSPRPGPIRDPSSYSGDGGDDIAGSGDGGDGGDGGGGSEGEAGTAGHASGVPTAPHPGDDRGGDTSAVARSGPRGGQSRQRRNQKKMAARRAKAASQTQNAL